MAELQEKTKAERISDEVKRLTGIYSKMDNKNRKILEGLIKRAAFMRITLEDYETDLDQGGYVEMFSQSPNTPAYERERPVARLYNTMNKNYQSIMKQLSDMLPKEIVKEKDDGFDGFVESK